MKIEEIRNIARAWTGRPTDLVKDLFFILSGTFIQSVSLRLFLIPMDLVSGGISGIAQLLNHFTGWPIGAMVFIGNVPMFLLGWRFLNGPRFVFRTLIAVVSYSIFLETVPLFLPVSGMTGDLVLNSLFGGVISGIGYGFVYKGRGTSGGSDILARILNHWRGIPISQSYLLTDTMVILFAGITFRWEAAMYALVTLYVSGLSAEATTEGSRVVRSVVIITRYPEAISDKVLNILNRGITLLPGRGMYTGEDRAVLYTAVSRSEVQLLKTLVHEMDPLAFMVIGQAQEVFGEGFRMLRSEDG